MNSVPFPVWVTGGTVLLLAVAVWVGRWSAKPGRAGRALNAPEVTEAELQRRKLLLEIGDLRYGWWKNSIPIVVTLAIAIGGWWFQYIQEQSQRSQDEAVLQTQHDALAQQRYQANIAGLGSTNPLQRQLAIADLATADGPGAPARTAADTERVRIALTAMLATEDDHKVLTALTNYLIKNFDQDITFSDVLEEDRAITNKLGVAFGKEEVVRSRLSGRPITPNSQVDRSVLDQILALTRLWNGFQSAYRYDDAGNPLSDIPSGVAESTRESSIDDYARWDAASLIKEQAALDKEVRLDVDRLTQTTLVLSHFLARPHYAAGQNLSGIVLAGLHTPLLDLSGANLSTSILQGTATRADFLGANLDNSSLWEFDAPSLTAALRGTTVVHAWLPATLVQDGRLHRIEGVNWWLAATSLPQRGAPVALQVKTAEHQSCVRLNAARSPAQNCPWHLGPDVSPPQPSHP